MNSLLWVAALVLALVVIVQMMSKRSTSQASLAREPNEQRDMKYTTHSIAPGRLMEVAVHGEAQRNADGISRQDIIARLKEGEYVKLFREPENHFDSNAVRIDSALGTIGYIPASQCASIGALLKSRPPRKCYIDRIDGGYDRNSNLGVWLKIEF